MAAVQWKGGPRLSARLQYTFSRNYDDDSNERNFSKEWTLNPFDLSLERAYSKQDLRHNCNVMATYALPRELKFSAVLIARSGLPFTPIVGTDMQNDANDDNDRAIINGRVAGRNSMRQPGFFDLDVRLARLFQIRDRIGLELVGDLFNATRAANRNFGNDAVSEYGKPGAPVAAAGQPLYAPSTARFGGPRQLQLGVRVVW